MAACGLQHIFDTPLPENPTLLESLSPWNQIKKVKPLDHHRPSFTEIFGELHFNENPPPPLPSYGGGHKKSESLQSGSLQMCTEGLGVESSDNVMADFGDAEAEAGGSLKVNKPAEQSCCRDLRRSRSMSGGGGFPPPISSIGKSGKPWVSFKPYRKDGRFMLKEVRIPTQDVLEACREDGRLKLHFVHEDDENLEEEENNDEDQQSEDDEDSDEYSDEENEEKEKGKEIEAISSVQET